VLGWSNDGAFLAVLTAAHRQAVVFVEQVNALMELARLDSSTGSFAGWLLWQPVPN
jgi:hypothetical protein